MNWRRRDSEYPRFRDHGNTEGIRTQAIREFDRFAEWVVTRTRQPLEMERFELTKIDVLKQGDQFEDTAQLQELLTVARVFSDIQISAPQLLHLRLVETHDDATTNVQIVANQDEVRIETRHLFPAEENVRNAFDRANQRVNQVFFGLFKDGLASFGVI